MRRIWYDVGKERLILVGFDKFDALIKPVVRAKSLEPLQLAIYPIGIVEIIIAPIVWCLANTARAMIDGVLKAAILGAKWISVTEVPFTEDSSSVTVIAKNICHRHFATAKQIASLDRVPNPNSIRVAPRHPSRTSRRAGWIYVKVVK